MRVRQIPLHPIAAAAVLALVHCTAGAQSAPASSQQVQQITVTAQRTAEDIRSVPVSVSAISGEQLDALTAGGEDIRLLSGRVPSLNIESSFGRAFPRFYIRGLGNTDFDLNASQPVSLVYDDVVQENPILKGFPVFDLAQVEVVRGPQGTLFGRNTPAGVVKFDSVKPSHAQDGYASASYGRFNTVNLETGFNLPLGGAWSARVSGLAQHRDDWVDNTVANAPTQHLEGYNDQAARLQVGWAPDPGFSALFNLHGRHLDGSARLFRANILKPGTNELVDGFDPARISIDGRNEQKLNGTGANLRLKWSLGDVALHSITGYESVRSYSRGDVDGGFGAAFAPPSGPGLIPFPSESADGLPKHRQVTQEIRLESAPAVVSWQAGAYWFDEDITIDSYSYDTLGGGAENGYAQQHQRNKAAAVFGSLKWAVTDALGLRGGLRYTHDKKDFTATRTSSPIGGGAIGPLSANPSDSNVSWDVSGTYVVDPAVSVYARVATAFRAPSVQGRILFGDSLSQADSEKNLSSEVGVKADLFDKRARIGFDVFRYTLKNQQLTAVGGTNNFNTLVNARRTEGHGFELDLQAVLAERLTMTANASYNKTRIDDPNLAIAPCSGGCTVLDPAGPTAGTVLIDGNPLPQAPKWIANLTLRYGIPMAGGEAFVYTDWSYRSKVNFFLYESVEFTGKSLTTGGVRVGYASGDGRWEVAAFGRNITNQIRVVGGIDFNNLTGFINEPRTWGVQGRVTF
jgi:iron complex outermembrane receptor protein